MAGRLLLILIIYSCHELSVGGQSESLPQPALTVTPHVITDTDSVTLSCQTPPSVTASQCDFYIEAEIISSVSCVQNLTGTDLLKTARRRSPAEVKVRCFYTVMLDALKSTSPDSNHTTITINNLRPPQLTVNPLVITETDTVTLNCQTPSGVSDCLFILKQEPAKIFPCLKTLTGTELLSLARQSSPAHVEVTCFYLISHPSPKSQTSTIIIQLHQPTLTVNPRLITETGSVTLSCVTPSLGSECHLYFMRTKIFRNVSCLQTFTGSELLFMAHQSPPAEVEVRCFYTVKNRGGEHKSPHSDTSSISIRDVLETATSQQTPTFSMMTEPAESTTQTRPTLSMTTVSGQTHTVLPHVPTTSLNLTTAKAITDQTLEDLRTSAATTPEPEPTKWMQKLVVAVIGCGVAVGVIFLWAVLFCPHRRSEKRFHKRSHGNITGDLFSMTNMNYDIPAGNVEVYNMLTYVPAADDSTVFEPLNSQDPQNVESVTYHVYASIPDEPPAPASEASAYSTVQAH
ncbi:uncharacterized protein LOC114436282 isoform X2 [Parambassis ranga]|uniref:Uncharacterized protein LOC114436282 isoform X2 n=1 Tax=Parambassis ranga TaxID=210632 RepID=A0A6P7INY4_9TELE|nr:uncharacterized protein LOC114436282 isoform X2 [Parambassis ranga]